MANKVLRSDKFAYDKNKKNLTLQSLQREFVASMNKCSDPHGDGLQGYTLHCTVSKGDWKHKREWLEQSRHYSNSSGKICPRCLCEQNWADMTESFNNSDDLDLAAQSSVGASISCRGMHMYMGVHTFVFSCAQIQRILNRSFKSLEIQRMHELHGWMPSVEYPDLLHCLWLGTGRDASASLLLEYARFCPEAQCYPTWDERLRFLHHDFQIWCKTHRIRGSTIDDMSILVN